MTYEQIRKALEGASMVLAEHLRELTILPEESANNKKLYLIGYLAALHDTGQLPREQVVVLVQLVHSRHLWPTLRHTIQEVHKW